MADQNAYEQPQPRKSGASALLWILGIGAVGLVVCCGAAGVVAWRFGDAAKNFLANMSTDDPAEVRRWTAEMLEIEIPESFEPAQGVNMGLFRMTVYHTDPAAAGSGGMLMLMEMTMQRLGVNAQQQEQELRKSMRQQQGNQDFQTSKTETREIEIRGEKTSFEFSEGTSDVQGQERKIHMVSGVVRGKRGPVMLQLVIPDEEYNEDDVLQMLESIK